jgi:hypothetical protein
MRGCVVGWGVLMLMAVARPADAQGAGDVGVTFAYPGSIGLVWQIGSRVAVRPDFSIVQSDSESTSTSTQTFPGFTPPTTTSRSDGVTTTTGLSLLFTVKTIDQVRLYLTPRLAYGRSTSETETGLGGVSSAIESTNEAWIGAGSFGAEFRAHDRFAMFGELGVQYVSQTSESTFSASRSRGEATQVGLRSAVGVTVYF